MKYNLWQGTRVKFEYLTKMRILDKGTIYFVGDAQDNSDGLFSSGNGVIYVAVSTSKAVRFGTFSKGDNIDDLFNEVSESIGELRKDVEMLRSGKQDLLIPGDGISIKDGVISSDGAGSDNAVELPYTVSWHQPAYDASVSEQFVKIVTIPKGASVCLRIKSVVYGNPQSNEILISNGNSVFLSSMFDGGFVCGGGGAGKSAFLCIPKVQRSGYPFVDMYIQIAHCSCDISDLVWHSGEYADIARPKIAKILYQNIPPTPETSRQFAIEENEGSVSLADVTDFIGVLQADTASQVDIYVTGEEVNSVYRFAFTKKIGGVRFVSAEGIEYVAAADEIASGSTVTVTAIENEAGGWSISYQKPSITSSDESVQVEWNEGVADLKVDKFPKIHVSLDKIPTGDYPYITAQLCEGDTFLKISQEVADTHSRQCIMCMYVGEEFYGEFMMDVSLYYDYTYEYNESGESKKVWYTYKLECTRDSYDRETMDKESLYFGSEYVNMNLSVYFNIDQHTGQVYFTRRRSDIQNAIYEVGYKEYWLKEGNNIIIDRNSDMRETSIGTYIGTAYDCDDAVAFISKGKRRTPTLYEYYELLENTVIRLGSQSVMFNSRINSRLLQLKNKTGSNYNEWMLSTKKQGGSGNSYYCVKTYTSNYSANAEVVSKPVYEPCCLFYVSNEEGVDLGLPSGLKWGVETSREMYAWGEVDTKEEYTLDNYRFWDGKKITKYNDEDMLNVLTNKYVRIDKIDFDLHSEELRLIGNKTFAILTGRKFEYVEGSDFYTNENTDNVILDRNRYSQDYEGIVSVHLPTDCFIGKEITVSNSSAREDQGLITIHVKTGGSAYYIISQDWASKFVYTGVNDNYNGWAIIH